MERRENLGNRNTAASLNDAIEEQALVNLANQPNAEKIQLIDNFGPNHMDVEAIEDEDGDLCMNCFSSFATEDFFALSCGHSFCASVLDCPKILGNS